MVVITKDMEINKKKLSLWEDKEAMDNNKKLLWLKKEEDTTTTIIIEMNGECDARRKSIKVKEIYYVFSLFNY